MLLRRVSAALLLGGILATFAPARADRRDQKAADTYEEARDLIRKKKYQAGIAKLNECLARGATEPTENQGSETRYLAKNYDPYYWLGVAQMEMGLVEQALTNFEKSEAAGAITGWKAEYADLKRRRETLLAKLEPPPPARATAVIAAAPSPTPIRVAEVLLPTRPHPVPSPTPFAIRLPTAPAPPTPSPVSREAEYHAYLKRGLEALARGDWPGVEQSVELARKANPRAPQPELLLCTALSSRYILGGKRDAAALEAARRSLSAWRVKAGKDRPLPRILSPAVREMLQ